MRAFSVFALLCAPTEFPPIDPEGKPRVHTAPSRSGATQTCSERSSEASSTMPKSKTNGSSQNLADDARAVPDPQLDSGAHPESRDAGDDADDLKTLLISMSTGYGRVGR